jgi:SAM-dependent methyltransferase
MTTTTTVDPRYEDRAHLYAVETSRIERPQLLRALLDRAAASGGVVAEVPSGAGHFLRSYRDAGVRVVLLDAEPRMLAAARRNAGQLGMAVETHTVRLGTNTSPARFGAVVVPNAAVNYLTALLGASITVAALADLVAPGGAMLVQAIASAEGGAIDRCGCYDAALPHDRWLAEWSRPDGSGGVLVRRRLQRRDGDRISVRFQREHNGAPLPESSIEMRALDLDALAAEMRAHGLVSVERRPGGKRLSELLAVKKEKGSAT